MVSRAAGLIIIFSLLVAFIVADARGKSLDVPICLAFLSLAAGLIGIPSGWTITHRKNGTANGEANGH